MGIFNRSQKTNHVDTARSSSEHTAVAATPPFGKNDAEDVNGDHLDNSKVPRITLRTFVATIIASMGGIIFGYDTGQISGFLEMSVFLARFGIYDPTNPAADAQGYYFSNVRSGLIVALLSIGTLIGCLIAGPVSNKFGRRTTMPLWCLIFCIGVVVQMAVQNGQWVGIVMGRWVAGLGVGGLSVLTPLYVSESTPKQVRGAAVCSYQLFITIGILLANIVNYGTESINNTGSYRIPMGIGFAWAIILAGGIMMMPESPRWDIKHGNHERAFNTMTKFYGVSRTHRVVDIETKEINAALDAASGDHKWYETFTAPRMFYRVALGMAMQMWQQLTGANFFFYYGTSVFKGVGIQNSYTTACILGAVNVLCTFPGLYFVEKFGRRKCMFWGALWQCMCFLVFASVGQFQFLPASAVDAAGNQLDPATAKTSGTVMIVFACLFIASFASTWGPMVWAVIGEMYPYRYRAVSMGLATSSNWLWNFMLAFFTPFITGDIDYQYGYVFAGCNFAAALTVYFFLMESSGRTLEEVDYMYIIHVSPLSSSKWDASQAGENVNTDNLYLEKGGRSIKKRDESGREGVVMKEDVAVPASAQEMERGAPPIMSGGDRS